LSKFIRSCAISRGVSSRTSGSATHFGSKMGWSSASTSGVRNADGALWAAM
jgi:hypothetical protein